MGDRVTLKRSQFLACAACASIELITVLVSRVGSLFAVTIQLPLDRARSNDRVSIRFIVHVMRLIDLMIYTESTGVSMYHHANVGDARALPRLPLLRGRDAAAGGLVVVVG